MATTRFVIGLGSNRGFARQATPRRMIAAGVAALREAGLEVSAVSAVSATPALGPAGRDFANAAALISTPLDPPALLALLKAIERRLGRRPGRRWGARTLDLDILAWEGGAWRSRTLTVPHAALAARRFAIRPAASLAPGWRHPRTGLTLRQIAARLG